MQLIQLLVRHLLIPDVGANHFLIPSYGRDEVALAQNLWPRKFRTLRSTFCAIQIELFPFRYPITSATEYFGGIDISKSGSVVMTL